MTLTCEYDQASIDTFTYVFDDYKTRHLCTKR